MPELIIFPRRTDQEAPIPRPSKELNLDTPAYKPGRTLLDDSWNLARHDRSGLRFTRLTWKADYEGTGASDVGNGHCSTHIFRACHPSAIKCPLSPKA